MKISLFDKFFLVSAKELPDAAAAGKGNPDHPMTKSEAVDFIVQIYGEVRAYDLHYSTTRSAVTTFIAGLAITIVPFIISNALMGDKPMPIATFELIIMGGFLISLALLVAALAISAHFQSLTYACERYQAVLENELESAVSTGYFNISRLKFREQLKNLATRRLWSDPPQQCLVLVVILQLILMLSSFAFFKKQSTCLREKPTERFERCLYDKIFGPQVTNKPAVTQTSPLLPQK
jgi:hypothetical protein